MAQIPGMLGEVFWGEPDAPVPNWRDFPRPDGDEDDIDDERPLTAAEREHLSGLLGFDIDEDEDDDEDHRPLKRRPRRARARRKRRK